MDALPGVALAGDDVSMRGVVVAIADQQDNWNFKR